MDQSGRYTVVRVQNDHDALTVRETTRNSTYHVVECDGEAVEAVLDEAERDDVLHMELRRVGRRGNAWCAENATPAVGLATPAVTAEDR
jgi:hypothetical protein